MILDLFKPYGLTFQIQYASAYIFWDRMGLIGQRLCKVWPGLKFKQDVTQQQTFVADRTVIRNGFEASVVTLLGDKVFDEPRVLQIQKTFEIWRELLELDVLTRISTRVHFGRSFPTLKEANAALFAMKLTQWPAVKVFDQPIESEKNGLEIAYRFEDPSSFSVLRIKAEHVKAEAELDPEYFEESKLKREKIRLVIDFDRGLLGSVTASSFRVDEWIKGYHHLLRRDIEKILVGTA